MTALLSPNAKQQFFDNAGAPAAGYLLHTYAAGTTTPLTTYSNRAGTVPNANPVVLDARGEATIYLTSGVVYDYALKTAQGATVWTREGVSALAGDAAAIVFQQAGTGAAVRTALAKLQEIAVSPEDFGAVGDGVTDDTTALQLMVTHVNTTSAPIHLIGRYVSTQSLAFTVEELSIHGDSAIKSALMFRGCHGITLRVDPLNVNVAFNLRDFALVTNAAGLYVGFDLNNDTASTTSGGWFSNIERVLSIGEDKYLNPEYSDAQTLMGWLQDYKLFNHRRVRMRDCRAHGVAAWDVDDPDTYPAQTNAVYCENTHHLRLENCFFWHKHTAVKCANGGENVEILGGAYVSVINGVDIQSGVVSNDHNITRLHVSSTRSGIKLFSPRASNISSSSMHHITENNLFQGGTSGAHTAITINGDQISVTDNTIFTATSITDPGARSFIGVDVEGGSANKVCNNSFNRSAVCINTRADANFTTIAGNSTLDDATTVLSSFLTDSGTNTQIGENFSTRDSARRACTSFQNSQKNANYTMTAADAGRVLTKSDTNAYTYTIPLGVIKGGSVIRVYNRSSGGNITVAAAGGMTITQAGTGTAGSVTISPYGAREFHFLGSLGGASTAVFCLDLS